MSLGFLASSFRGSASSQQIFSQQTSANTMTVEEILSSLTQQVQSRAITVPLKPYHSANVSLLAYAVKTRLLTAQEYADATFPVVGEFHNPPSTTNMYRPIVLSFYETDVTLVELFKRAFPIPAEKKLFVWAVLSRDDGPKWILDITNVKAENEAGLRLLKMRAGHDILHARTL